MRTTARLAILLLAGVAFNLGGCPGGAAGQNGAGGKGFDVWAGGLVAGITETADPNTPADGGAADPGTGDGGAGSGTGGGSGGGGVVNVVLGDNNFRDNPGINYDGALQFADRDALVVSQTADFTLAFGGPSEALAALDQTGGLHVLVRATDTPPTQWFTVQRLVSAVTRFRLLPGVYRIGPAAEYFAGGSSGLVATVATESTNVQKVAGATLDPGRLDSALEQAPVMYIYSNTGLTAHHLENLRNNPSDYVNFYRPYGLIVAMSFCRLSAGAEEFSYELGILQSQIPQYAAAGIPVIPWSGMFDGHNQYDDWFNPAVWDNAAARFLQAVNTLGAREYVVDFEPYWSDPRSFPEPGYETWRCWAAMSGFLNAVRQADVKFYAIATSGYAPIEALANAAPQKVTIWSENSYELPTIENQWWLFVDSENAGAAALGRQVLPGYLDQVLWRPTASFLPEQRARRIDRFWVFPRIGTNPVWQNYVDRFYTRSWFDQ